MVPGDKWVTVGTGETRCYASEGEEFELASDLRPGDLFWSGRLGRPGRYYVVAQHQGRVPGTYRLKIVGAEVASQ